MSTFWRATTDCSILLLIGALCGITLWSAWYTPHSGLCFAVPSTFAMGAAVALALECAATLLGPKHAPPLARLATIAVGAALGALTGHSGLVPRPGQLDTTGAAGSTGALACTLSMAAGAAMLLRLRRHSSR